MATNTKIKIPKDGFMIDLRTLGMEENKKICDSATPLSILIQHDLRLIVAGGKPYYVPHHPIYKKIVLLAAIGTTFIECNMSIPILINSTEEGGPKLVAGNYVDFKQNFILAPLLIYTDNSTARKKYDKKVFERSNAFVVVGFDWFKLNASETELMELLTKIMLR